MENLFLAVVHMSLLGSYIIGVVLLLRLLLRRAPKFLSYLLWAVVFIRLIVPISIESPISLVPGALNAGIASETASASVQADGNAAISESSGQTGLQGDISGAQSNLQDGDGQSGIHGSSNAAGALEPSENADASTMSGANGLGFINSVLAIVKNHSVLIFLACSIWLLGILTIGTYNLVLTMRLKKKLSSAMQIREGIYVSSLIQTPFVFGLYRPRIYLPNTVGEGEREYIICHEQVHIRRYDYLVKTLAFAITCVHWFNPLVWFAYILMGHDMEMSCDEKVLMRYGSQIKKEYSGSLLAMAVRADSVRGPMIAFGKNDVKQRISHVLKFKKARVASVVVLVAICIAVMVMLLTNQSKNDSGLFAYETQSTQVSTEADNTMESNTSTEQIMSTETPAGEGSSEQNEIATNEQELNASAARESLNQAESELRKKMEEEKASEEEISVAVGELYYQYAKDAPAVTSAEMFHILYQDIADFDGSGMDFIDNGYGKKLNETALLSSSNEYRALFNPTDAPIQIFHLSGGTVYAAYSVPTETNPDQPDTSGDVYTDYEFSDGTSIRFLMKQPYGENGIWLVENILPVENEQEENEQNAGVAGTDSNSDTTYIIEESGGEENASETPSADWNAEQLENKQ